MAFITAKNQLKVIKSLAWSGGMTSYGENKPILKDFIDEHVNSEEHGSRRGLGAVYLKLPFYVFLFSRFIILWSMLGKYPFKKREKLPVC